VKLTNPLIRFLIVIVFAVTVVFVYLLAVFIMDQHKMISDGILGASYLYLIFRAFLYRETSKSTHDSSTSLGNLLFEYPENAKGLIFFSFLFLTGYMALTNIITTIEIFIF
jgi:hypothetical protein